MPTGMNFGQMREILARDVLQQDDVNESLDNSMKFVHRELQRDLDWRAMEKITDDILYAANNIVGITVDAVNYKRSYEVYSHVGSAFQPILPTTEGEANKLRRIAQNTRQAAPTAAGYIQRWYESALRVVLLIPPTADLQLQVRYYAYLPFYTDQPSNTATITQDPVTTANSQILVSGADDDKFEIGQSVVLSTDETIVKVVTGVDLVAHKITLNSTRGLANGDVLNLGATADTAADATDYFSMNMPEALIYGAAYHLSKNIGEDTRADSFMARYTSLVTAAAAADQMAKQGGAYRVRRPPMAMEAQGKS